MAILCQKKYETEEYEQLAIILKYQDRNDMS